MILEELIVTHELKVEAWPNIVYVRKGNVEVGVKYKNTNGDKAQALRSAVKQCLQNT